MKKARRKPTKLPVLTEKQRMAFARQVTAGKTPALAYRDTFPELCHEVTQRAIYKRAQKLIAQEDIKKMMEGCYVSERTLKKAEDQLTTTQEAIATAEIVLADKYSKEKVLREIWGIATDGENESTRLKALELTARLMGHMADTKNLTQINLNTCSFGQIMKQLALPNNTSQMGQDFIDV